MMRSNLVVRQIRIIQWNSARDGRVADFLYSVGWLDACLIKEAHDLGTVAGCKTYAEIWLRSFVDSLLVESDIDTCMSHEPGLPLRAPRNACIDAAHGRQRDHM